MRTISGYDYSHASISAHGAAMHFVCTFKALRVGPGKMQARSQDSAAF
jgi:hypothetical protein